MLKKMHQHNSSDSRLPAWLFHLMNFGVISFLILLLLFVGGFIRFANNTAESQDQANAAAISSGDAIVILTGGTNRLKQALELLQKKKNTRLLISGVHPDTTKQQLQRLTNTEAALFECCVDIDHEALNTVGNAKQTTQWAQKNGFKSLIVVTSNYHMPRSILLLERANPNIEYIEYPIKSSRLNYQKWTTHLNTLQVLIKEYIKYMFAYWRVT